MPSKREDILDVAVRVAGCLERLQVRYALVGSLASSLQGDPRSTNDIDFVSTLSVPQISELVRALGDDFDVDEASRAEAIRTAGSWNIYFLPWMTKVDLFALDSSDELRCTQLSRAEPTRIGEQSIVVLRPDDTILSKLLWYRDGGETSDQQWRDIVGVLRISAQHLDNGYLDKWARKVGIESLLARARNDAGSAVR